MFGVESETASGHSAGQTADGAVTRSAARTDYCCSPNKAFIARMCVHDPKESRVTTVRVTSEGTSYTACCLNQIRGSQTYQSSDMCCQSGDKEQQSFFYDNQISLFMFISGPEKAVQKPYRVKIYCWIPILTDTFCAQLSPSTHQVHMADDTASSYETNQYNRNQLYIYSGTIHNRDMFTIAEDPVNK